MLPIMGLSTLVACSSDQVLHDQNKVYGEPNATGASSPEITDTYIQDPLDRFDMLWVIDNSGSMNDEQVILHDQFPVFYETIVQSNSDWHLGVITTDAFNGGNGDSGHLRTVGGHRWIEPHTPDALSVFQEMAFVGISGSGTESGLATSYRAIYESQGPGEFNEGFLRDNANLQITFVSDEDDQTNDPINLAEYIHSLELMEKQKQFVIDGSEDELPDPNRAVGLLNDMTPGARALFEQRALSNISTNAIVGMTGSGCVTPSVGARYLGVRDNLGGLAWPICQPNWKPQLEQMAFDSSLGQSEFYLSKIPVIDSIYVEYIYTTYDGTEIHRVPERGTDWEYLDNRNSIKFFDPEAVPPPLAKINITYLPLASYQGMDASDQVSDFLNHCANLMVTKPDEDAVSKCLDIYEDDLSL